MHEALRQIAKSLLEKEAECKEEIRSIWAKRHPTQNDLDTAMISESTAVALSEVADAIEKALKAPAGSPQRYGFGPEPVFGIVEPLPLAGFPAGHTRIRMRNNEYVRVYVRPPEGGVRQFAVSEIFGQWVPVCELGANVVR